MKSSTYTSNILSSVKLAKPHLSNSEFQYGFFTRDETVVEGAKPKRVGTSPDRVLSQLRNSPRYVVLSFDPPNSNVPRSVTVEDIKLVKENISKIYSAEDVGNTSATTVLVQDTGLLDRVYRTIRRSADLRGISGNLTDISMRLGNSLGPAVDRVLLQDLTARFSEMGANFISDSSRIGSGKFGQVRSTVTSYTVSDKFVLDAVRSGELAGNLGPVSSAALLSDNVETLQNDARSEIQAISSNDYVTILEPVNIRESNAREFADGTELIATLVYRKETLQNGDEVTRLLDILPADSSRYFDHEIKLGATYHYWLHSVYRVTTHSLSVNTGQVVIAQVLFQSEASEAYTTRTDDVVPPPPPSDFDVRWDYRSKKLILSWAFPPLAQRDIKYFQVFRRSNLLESFTLLTEYDFNDSLAQPVRYENVLPSNSQKMNSPMTTYYDTEFRKDSDYIYCVASVDARGLVSNYSPQLRVTFDAIQNRLNVEQVSPGNAPRPYPNVFLRGDLFLDSIVTTGKRRLKIYFDPEYLKLVDRDGNDLGLFQLAESGKYKISILDVTRAESASVELAIKDLRNSIASS
jgi:hypothetical protein